MKKKLIIDDNVNHAVSMKDVIETKDYNVDTANSCTEALKLVEKTSYDLFLIDLVMPEINGVETFEKIKKINSKAKAISFTAFGVKEDGDVGLIVQAMSAGMIEEYLRKPIFPDELFEAIEKHAK